MLRYLVIVIFAMASRSLAGCISDFSNAEEAILNGTLGSGEVLSNIYPLRFSPPLIRKLITS